MRSGKKILVCDDHLQNRTMVGVFVDKGGSYYICQNTHRGASIACKYGYKHSWYLGESYEFKKVGENILVSAHTTIIFI